MSCRAAFRRAISTLGCPELTLESALALAGRFQLDAVELRALGGSFDLPAQLAASYRTPAALARFLAGQSIAVAALGTSLKLIGSGEPERAEFLRFIPWAEAMGVRYLRVFDGGKEPSAEALGQAAESVAWWRKRRAAEGWSVDIMVETHDAFVTSPAILELAARMPGLAILWDSHHTWRKGGEAPVETWGAIRPHVAHIHVKDSVASAAPLGYTYVAPGRGEFPMRALVAALRSEFAGTVSLEWEKYWAPYLEPLESALQSAADLNWWSATSNPALDSAGSL